VKPAPKKPELKPEPKPVVANNTINGTKFNSTTG
jgi:hypothetical protein